jgi:hypothetical protein
MLKFMVIAAPLLGGGVWAAGGLDAFTSAAAAHRERQAVCDDIVDRAIDDLRNSGFAATPGTAESAALESQAWTEAVATEIDEAGCDRDRAGARFIQGASGLMAGGEFGHPAAGEPTEDAEGIAPLPEMMRR